MCHAVEIASPAHYSVSCFLILFMSLQRQLDEASKQVVAANKELATMDLMQQLEEADQETPAAHKKDDVDQSSLKSQYQLWR